MNEKKHLAEMTDEFDFIHGNENHEPTKCNECPVEKNETMERITEIVKAIRDTAPNRPKATVRGEICEINEISISWESVIVNVVPMERDLHGLPYEVYLSEVKLLK